MLLRAPKCSNTTSSLNLVPSGILWFVVGMYLRFTSRANTDGSVVRYVALAHNRRVDGKIKPDVLMNLGRVDQVDVEGLRRLAASINKHFGDGDGPADAAEVGLAAGAAPLQVINARPVGATWLLDGLWRRLEVGAAVRATTDGRRFTTNMERVLVANRAVAPMSKLSAAEWVCEDAVIAGLSAMDEDQAYRAMDLLVDADTAGRVQEAVFFAVANLLNLEVDLLFFDTTSTYFERDEDDGDDALRRYGHAKENLRVKEVNLDGQDARFVVCHNPEQAERDKQHRDDAVTRIEAELARIGEQRERDRSRPPGDKTRKRNEAAHLRAECALRDHPTLGRWLRQQPNGRLRLNRAKIKAEERLDGRYLISTSDPHISAEDVAMGYKNLLEAERGFRDLKSNLLLRPVFHRLEHRIRAHVLICWLALLLTRVAERATGLSWRNINRQLGRITQVTLAGPAGTVTQSTPLKPEQKAIYQAISIDPPVRISVFDLT